MKAKKLIWVNNTAILWDAEYMRHYLEMDKYSLDLCYKIDFCSRTECLYIGHYDNIERLYEYAQIIADKIAQQICGDNNEG